MECNKEEALRAKELAEEKMRSGDFIGAQKLVMKAQQLFPNLENLSQLVAICDVHCSAQNKISGLENWYGILQVKHFADAAAIKKQYRKLALLLHPDKNKFDGAEAAFKLIGEANRLLSDHTKRSQYDVKYRIFSRVSASKPGNKQSNMNSDRQYAPANNAANSVGNLKPMNFAFWTCCQHCGFRYKYLREYANTVMHCSSCQKSYVAVDTGPYGVSPRSTPSQFSRPEEVSNQGPGNVHLQDNKSEPTGTRSGNAPPDMDTNMRSEEKVNENNGGDQNNDTEVKRPAIGKTGAKNDAKPDKSEENKGVTLNDAEVSKTDEVKPQSGVTESEDGAAKPTPDVTDPKGDETATVKSKDKKKRRKFLEESSESSEIDGCDDVGSEKASNRKNQRRSSREKRKVSYAEDGSDDDFVCPPSKASKSHREFKSDGNTKEAALGGRLCGSANSDSSAIAETHKEKGKKKVDSVSDDILSTKDKQSEGCEANGEDAFPSSEVDEIDKVSKANKEFTKLEEFPDPDFNNFDKTMSEFAANQVWALYDDFDGMPRYYARIRKVFTAQQKLHITWLELKQSPKYEIDDSVPVACGKYKTGEIAEMEDLLMFSHQMRCIKQGKISVIYPKKGEIWALFRDWDISWTTDPDKHRPPFEYDFVEVLSDFKEQDDHSGVSGIGVYYLEKVNGFVSLFVRATHGEVLACTFSPQEMYRFSHKVPSFRMTGTEGEGVPADSFELDPVSLPKDIFELDRHKVNAGKDRQNLDGKANVTCPKAPEVEVKSTAGPGSFCSPNKRQKTEIENGSISKVCNGISNDQDKIRCNVSLTAEVDDLTTSRGHDSSSCQVGEMTTIKKNEESDQPVGASTLRRSTRVLSERKDQTNSSQHETEKKTVEDGEVSARPDQYGPSGDNKNTPKRHEKDLMKGSSRIRRSPRGINKKTDGQLQRDPEKHESNNEPFSQCEDHVPLTDSKGSNSEKLVSSGCGTGQENALNFKDERSEDKFQVDQIWALYSADKGMPTEYGLIRKIETKPRFRLHITFLEPYQPAENLTPPVCCGLFKKKTGKPKGFPRSSFSHQVNVKMIDRASFEVYPRKGEIWALYKNRNDTTCTATSELEIVEVLENNGQIIKAMALMSKGSRNLYIAQRSLGSKTVVIDIAKEDVAKFSHQIPAFRRRDLPGCECWELDPAAVPGLTIVLD